MIRSPAVSGLFYPSDPVELRATVDTLLRNATGERSYCVPKALIVPHAGYVYSGSTAAAGYALLLAARDKIRRVVMIGPSHRVPLRGIAVPLADRVVTPFGEIPIDKELKSLLLKDSAVVESDLPHAQEHCLEVQWPFLQSLLEEFTLLPLLAGTASAERTAVLLNAVWGDDSTLVIASSDLSHYHSYPEAQRMDAATSATILAFEPTLTPEQACGAIAINSLLIAAGLRGLDIRETARCNSGDTAGGRDRVVGYGTYALH